MRASCYGVAKQYHSRICVQICVRLGWSEEVRPQASHKPDVEDGVSKDGPKISCRGDKKLERYAYASPKGETLADQDLWSFDNAWHWLKVERKRTDDSRRSNQGICQIQRMTERIFFDIHHRFGGHFLREIQDFGLPLTQRLSQGHQFFLVAHALYQLDIGHHGKRERLLSINSESGFRIAPHKPNKNSSVNEHDSGVL